MPNVGAEFTASIVIDKNDLITQALKQLSTVQKELEKNKLEIYFDLSNADLSKKLKEYQKQLSSTDYTIKINNNGIEETYKSLDKLLDIVKTIASGKDFGTGFGNINADNAVKQIDKLENRISELNKKYDELQKKSASGSISGKEVNLVDNDEFKKLSQEVSELKGQFDDLKTHMSLLDDYTVPTDRFFELQTQVEATSVKVSDLVDKMTRLSNIQKNIGAETNISSGLKDAIQENNSSVDSVGKVETKLDDAVISAKELDKALDGVNVPTDTFDSVLSKLDRTKSELIDIVKITKSWVSDAEGKGHEAYTLKDSRGSTEIYGISSKTDKGQILRQNIVQYDASTISKAKQEQDKLTEAMAKGREQAEKSRQAEEKRQELAQNNAINKALEEEYKERQKLAEATEKQIQKNKELALSYTESASDKLSKAISKYSYGDTSDATSMMKQMNKGLSNFGDLSNIEGNIKNFNSVIDNIISDLKHSHEESLKSINEEIKAESQLQSQKDSFYKSNLSAIDLEIKKREEEAKAFSNSLKAQMEAQQKVESQLGNYSNRLESYNKKTSGYDATIARFEDGGWTSDAYLKKVQAVKDAVAEYERILNNLKAHPELVTEEGLNDLAKQEKLIKENITAVQNMSAAEKGFTLLSGQKAMDKINSILKENSAMSKQAKNQIRAWYNEIASGNPSKNLSQILGEVQKIVNAEAEAGRAGKSMWDIFKDKSLYGGIARLAQYYLSFTDIIRYGRQAISTIVELDDALVDLKKTTSMSGSELENFYYDANDVAKQMGVTTAEIINQASAWSRLNKIGLLYGDI